MTSVKCAPVGDRRTNRWTGATGSDFRIKRDPAKLLGNAAAASTPPLCFFRFNIFGDCCERNTTISRKLNLIAAALFWVFFAATPHVAQTPLAGQWQGMLLREGSEAKVSVNFKPTPNGIEGTMTMLTVGMFRQPLSKIGRASCRERGYISVLTR